MASTKIMVTGGAGFIGSAFVRLLLRDCPRQSYGEVFKRGLSLKSRKGLSPQEAISEDTKGTVPKLIVVDKLTYAGDLKRLQGLLPKKGTVPKLKFYKADICDKRLIESIFNKEKPDIILNFAAATHVDRSIQDASPFIETNVKGTQVLLDISRKHNIQKFIQLSTDETYGEIRKGKFTENSPLKPNSPYAASKAAADLLIRSYIRTYGFPAVIIRPCNNYGPWQYPEKLIPLAILKVLKNEKIPVYADGKNVREWLYVEDCAEGILEILKKGRLGQIYNLGSNEERQNIKVVKMILDLLDVSQNMIQFVKDRPGHDIRYSLDSNKVFNEIGWRPKIKFPRGIKLTVDWYLGHKDWILTKWKR